MKSHLTGMLCWLIAEFGSALLWAQADVLDKAITSVVSALGGMAVPSILVFYLLRNTIPKLVDEMKEQRLSCVDTVKALTSHCEREIAEMWERHDGHVKSKDEEIKYLRGLKVNGAGS